MRFYQGFAGATNLLAYGLNICYPKTAQLLSMNEQKPDYNVLKKAVHLNKANINSTHNNYTVLKWPKRILKIFFLKY